MKAQLYEELHEVQELSDLMAKQERLKSLFDDISELAILAAQFAVSRELSTDIDELSQVLSDEMKRVLLIPGAGNILEKCQKSALEKLLLNKKIKKAH